MRTSSRTHRRGVAMVATIATLTLMIFVFVALLRLGLAEKAQVRAEERRMRASWLAESGLERAVARLNAARDYPGETWEIAAEELGGRDPAVVLIRVEPIADRPGARRVSARADYPRDASSRARQTKTTVIERNTSQESTDTVPGATP